MRFNTNGWRFVHELRQSHWLDWLGISTLAAATGLIFFNYPPADTRRWLAVATMVAVIAILFPHTEARVQTTRHPLRYGLLTLLATGLFYLGANFNGLLVLFFVLSAEVLAVLPGRIGYGWIGAWGVLTIVFLAQVTGEIPLALLNGFGVMCGYFFIGSAANAQRRAEAASEESQRLLTELQAAHRQLQAHAERAEELAMAQERNRLAREVHDTLGHRLTVAAVQLEGAQRLIERNPVKAAQMVATVRAQVVDGLNELRRTVAALRAPLESDLSLPAALTRLATNFQEATGIAAHLDLPQQLLPLPDEHRHTLYRTAQEGLTNVQRHAGAKNVWLQLTLVDAVGPIANRQPSIQLSIADDGRGLPPGHNGPGFGLRGLHERAEILHGQLQITNRPTGGTQVMLHLPLTTALGS
jgi:signal transduction histidine kinase